MIDLRLENTPDAIEQAAARVRELGVECGFNPRRLDEVGTAVREALCNAREHGNRGSADPPVRLTAEARGGTVLVEIRDSGEGLRMTPPVPDLLRQIQGRGPVTGWGFFLVRCFASEVVSKRSRAAGHTLRLRFDAAPPAAPVEPAIEGESHVAQG
jgi:serine/threonine-protein kinase RsbW